MGLRLPRMVGARLIKTGIAVSLATGLMSFFDPTRGLVGAGVSAALMIAPDDQVGKEWARNQFIAAFLGALAGALIGRWIGWAPWLTGVVVMMLILVFSKLGYTGAIIGGLSNCLFILEHTDRGYEYAAYRFLSSVAGLLIGWLVNRYLFPYKPQAPDAANIQGEQAPPISAPPKEGQARP